MGGCPHRHSAPGVLVFRPCGSGRADGAPAASGRRGRQRLCQAVPGALGVRHLRRKASLPKHRVNLRGERAAVCLKGHRGPGVRARRSLMGCDEKWVVGWLVGWVGGVDGWAAAAAMQQCSSDALANSLASGNNTIEKGGGRGRMSGTQISGHLIPPITLPNLNS